VLVAPVHCLVDKPPVQDLLLCAKHLFVTAMVAWVHLGLPRIGKSEHDGGAARVPSSPEAIVGSELHMVSLLLASMHRVPIAGFTLTM